MTKLINHIIYIIFFSSVFLSCDNERIEKKTNKKGYYYNTIIESEFSNGKLKIDTIEVFGNINNIEIINGDLQYKAFINDSNNPRSRLVSIASKVNHFKIINHDKIEYNYYKPDYTIIIMAISIIIGLCIGLLVYFKKHGIYQKNKNTMQKRILL